MGITKQQLREGALEAVKIRQYAPKLVSGPGIVAGARLRATAGPIAGEEIAVRTSQDREVGLLRRDDKQKKWRTIPKVRELVVAVPSLTNPDSSIEVLCFDSKTVVALFDAAVEKASSRALSYKAPVFVALDDVLQKGSGALAGGLGAKAKWREEIPLPSIAAKLPDQSDGFIERVKREFAERNGVDVSKVAVEFRIIA
jgi:hypothetical protein